MDTGFVDWLNRVEGKLDKLDEKIGAQPCKVHSERIQMLMKVVYGAVGVILIVWVLSTTGKDSIANKAAIANKQVKGASNK